MKFNKIGRRGFVKNTGIFTAAFLAGRLPVIAGPFLPGEISSNQIPEDKKLDPAWVKSLYERGSVTTYRKSKNELKYIGMPVGGIACGTVYLGGDGRLWLWDVFNKNQEGIEPKTVTLPKSLNDKKILSRDGANYVQPSENLRPLDQGFAFLIEVDGKKIVKKQEAEDWDEIEFEATYPVAKVRYIDTNLKLDISAEIYSPFIALDEHNSGLPATIYSFNLHNRSAARVTISIIGWLENKAAIESAKNDVHQRTNMAMNEPGLNAVFMSVAEKNKSQDLLLQQADFGTFCIASLAKHSSVSTDATIDFSEAMFALKNETETSKAINQKLLGSVAAKHEIAAGKTISSDFVISWHFPNLAFKGIEQKGRYYSKHFKHAFDVTAYIHQNYLKLSSLTKLFSQTWYDSTLPWWFLERSFLNISTLATTTSHRFSDGRFYAWEGVGCCPGTCTHVWQYAQAAARIFPALEKDTRERVDLGIAFEEETGAIWFRAEADKRPAIDGQAGTVLRIYREHQMSEDDLFLKKNWSRIKKAVQFVINQDRDKDGMEDTPMENTLDAVWDGEISWIVGLCIAAVKAGQMMAEEMNDETFATTCKTFVEKGTKSMEEKLFNGEYFIHRPDAEKGRKKLGSYNTCHIDQVYGQSWAFQAGLGRIIDQQKTLSSLLALWKYNFTPDVGPYINKHKGGRPYALAGEGGMIMNTNPKNEAKPYGEDETWQLGYFHECMSGFEHQVASHMMAEGMTDEALILTRMIHDRYYAQKRNPFNEIECSDHYARAMASYGTFINACGFQYHGPKGYIRFAPAWNKENFKAPFITAESWGSYLQQHHNNGFRYELQVKYGRLRLQQIRLQTMRDVKISRVSGQIGFKKFPVSFIQKDSDLAIEFPQKITIQLNQSLLISIK